MKVLLSTILIISILVTANIGYIGYADDGVPKLKIVVNQNEIQSVLKSLSKNSNFQSVKNLNFGLLNKHFLKMAYIPEKKVYTIAMEEIIKNPNKKDMGWALGVVYDLDNNKLIDSTYAEVQLDTVKIKNFSKMMDKTVSRDKYEKDQKEFNNNDTTCECAENETSIIDKKNRLSTFIESVIAPKANAMSESEKCGWQSVVMCALFGLITGGWGGLICSASMMYVCTYVPLSCTNWYGKTVPC